MGGSTLSIVLMALQIASTAAPIVEPLAIEGIKELTAWAQAKIAAGQTHLAPGELEHEAKKLKLPDGAIDRCLAHAHETLQAAA